MVSHTHTCNERHRFAAWPSAAPFGLCVGVLLALCANDACAAALGSLATSVGLFAALASLFVIKGWPTNMPAAALSGAGGALVIAGGAAWLWRAHVAGRSLGLSEPPGSRRTAHASAVAARPAPAHAVSVQLPAGLDRDALLTELRLVFVRLQEAWDLGAMPALQALTTTDMLTELCLGLPACSGAGGRTDVVTLRADLFGFEELNGAYVVSVEFSGLMREAPDDCAVPFREVWMLTRFMHGAEGWKLARHQALI